MIVKRSSARWLARKIGVARELLRSLASDPDGHYRSFIIKAPGKKPREIDNPDEDLKTVQREIRARLLAPLPLPEHVHGCRRARRPAMRSPITSSPRWTAIATAFDLKLSRYFIERQVAAVGIPP